MSYLLTMINDCQLSCMHQEQSHTSCNNYSWQILTSTMKPCHSIDLMAHFSVQAILIQYSGTCVEKKIQYVQFWQNRKQEKSTCVHGCIHTYTHSEPHTSILV